MMPGSRLKLKPSILPGTIFNINEISVSWNENHNAEMRKFKEKMVKQQEYCCSQGFIKDKTKRVIAKT